MEKERNIEIIKRNNKERQNSESETYKRCKEYVETGVYCEKCNSLYHYECEDAAKKQIIKMYPGKHNLLKRSKKWIWKNMDNKI